MHMTEEIPGIIPGVLHSLSERQLSQGGRSHKLFSLIKTMQMNGYHTCISKALFVLMTPFAAVILTETMRKTFLEYNFSEEVGSPDNQLLVYKP